MITSGGSTWPSDQLGRWYTAANFRRTWKVIYKSIMRSLKDTPWETLGSLAGLAGSGHLRHACIKL